MTIKEIKQFEESVIFNGYLYLFKGKQTGYRTPLTPELERRLELPKVSHGDLYIIFQNPERVSPALLSWCRGCNGVKKIKMVNGCDKDKTPDRAQKERVQMYVYGDPKVIGL